MFATIPDGVAKSYLLRSEIFFLKLKNGFVKIENLELFYKEVRTKLSGDPMRHSFIFEIYLRR